LFRGLNPIILVVAGYNYDVAGRVRLLWKRRPKQRKRVRSEDRQQDHRQYQRILRFHANTVRAVLFYRLRRVRRILR
jgi:hypothetical protein